MWQHGPVMGVESRPAAANEGVSGSTKEPT